MDCDLSHPPEKLAEKLPEMRDVLLERDAGLVLGRATFPAAARTAGAARDWP